MYHMWIYKLFKIKTQLRFQKRKELILDQLLPNFTLMGNENSIVWGMSNEMHEKQFVSLRVNPPKRKFGNALLSFVGTEQKWYKLHVISIFFFISLPLCQFFIEGWNKWRFSGTIQLDKCTLNFTYTSVTKGTIHAPAGDHFSIAFAVHHAVGRVWILLVPSFIYLFFYFYLELFPRLIFAWKGSTLASFTLGKIF